MLAVGTACMFTQKKRDFPLVIAHSVLNLPSGEAGDSLRFVVKRNDSSTYQKESFHLPLRFDSVLKRISIAR